MEFNYFDFMTQAKKGYSRFLEPVCRELGLTRSELDVLLFLANNPDYNRAVDIVSHRGMSKSHVSLSVSTLESKGLLRRQEDPADRRTVHLELTGSADRIVEAGRAAQRAFVEKLHEGISREEMEAMGKIALKINENIKAMEG